ncbi:hypothetical protein PPL_09696 [Heterostelium album PN500]|uniref:peptide deformylase n=1 Tax=Heterostelium pallidum (strain ATCC 26659 / Pp 5 / PN500) TaxID=670386 RepID=D3BNJ3_HETP5|nr:hypothetical protein PPL_09696 [Heterostelium album PN500]EFA76944.1 hypothetical protein PPL_09696 [Heterostelium album PN500]|eukprot:XP_020429076.1 hypothetical protein PPL_09696 [Heterostelium album PN500]
MSSAAAVNTSKNILKLGNNLLKQQAQKWTKEEIAETGRIEKVLDMMVREMRSNNGCDISGKDRSIEADGIISACLQHENDHLLGRVFIERLKNGVNDLVHVDEMKHEDFNEIFTLSGLCSRSKALSYIGINRVTVLGQKVSPKTKVNVEDVRIMGKKLENTNPYILYYYYYSKRLTIAVHKPNGYICSNAREGDHKIIYDLLPPEFAKRLPTLSVAGRLDKWVTGLVLMSQDGKIVERIITPKDDSFGKIYDVVCKAPFKGNEAEAFESGTMMLRSEEEPCKAAKFEVLDNDRNLARLTLYEGRYHQVRRMMAALDNKAMEIHRIKVGPIDLGDLPAGKWRYLTEEEMEKIKAIQVTKSALTKKKYNKKKLDNSRADAGEDDIDEDDEGMDDIDEDEEDEGDDDDFNEDDFMDELEKEDLEKQRKSKSKEVYDAEYNRKLQTLIRDEKIQSGLIGVSAEEEEQSPAVVPEGVDPRDLITNEEVQEQLRKAILAKRSNVRFNKRGEVMGMFEREEDEITETDASRLIEEDSEYQEFLKEDDQDDQDDQFFDGFSKKDGEDMEDDDDNLLSGLNTRDRTMYKNSLPSSKKKSNKKNFEKEINKKQLRDKLKSRRNK